MSQTLFREASPPARAKAAPGFVCTSRGGDVGVAWVHVAGELDLATSPRLEQTLRRAHGRAGLVVLDLRELAFMDCVGMHVIVDAAIRARRDYRRLIVVRGPAPVDKVFTLTGAFQHLEIIDLGPGDRRGDPSLGTPSVSWPDHVDHAIDVQGTAGSGVALRLIS